ncbi:MAG: hypothetical protein JWP89_2239 [Schlesneria sp.]|nr:hypothetical protein [Schlesneria sp.]
MGYNGGGVWPGVAPSMSGWRSGIGGIQVNRESRASTLTSILSIQLLAQFSAAVSIAITCFAADPTVPKPPTAVRLPVVQPKLVPPSALDGPPLKDVPTWSELARAIVLTAIPDKYVDRKHWDKTREIFDGISVQQRGFNIRMSERKRKVNHGSWYMYTIRFPNPEQNLKLVIDQIQSQGTGKFSFAVHVAMKNIQLHGQFEQWVMGVKGLNFDFESDVEVHMHAIVQMSIRPETKRGSLLPDLVLDPAVHTCVSIWWT